MINVGDIISNRKIYGIFNDQFCIAKAVVESPEPYVVWNIEPNGNGVYSGRYYTDKMDAEWCYAGLCFDWFEDNMQINMVENGELPLFQKLMKDVEYAKISGLPLRNLHEVYGRIKMARELNAITNDEFMVLNHICVAEGINNPKYFSNKQQDIIENISFFEYTINVLNDGKALTSEQKQKLIELSFNEKYRGMDSVSFLQNTYPIIFNITI